MAGEGVATRGALPRLRGRWRTRKVVRHAIRLSALYVTICASSRQGLVSRFTLIRHQPCSRSASQARQRSTGGDPSSWHNVGAFGSPPTPGLRRGRHSPHQISHQTGHQIRQKKAVESSGLAGVFYWHSSDPFPRHAPWERTRALGRNSP